MLPQCMPGVTFSGHLNVQSPFERLLLLSVIGTTLAFPENHLSDLSSMI
jgi:hypothetical protein